MCPARASWRSSAPAIIGAGLALPVVQRAARRRCSWATPAASRSAARSARSRSSAHHEIVLGDRRRAVRGRGGGVIIQVFFYKRTGKRVFRMAPIHHHFEQLGWAEPTVVIRFWIISFVLALAGLVDAEAAVITDAPAFRRQALRGARARALGAGDGARAARERRAGDGVGRARGAARWRSTDRRRDRSTRPICRST